VKYCASHVDDIATALRRRGLWRYVDSSKPAMARNLARWMKGETRKGEIDPAVVIMFEIAAKAARLGPLPVHFTSLPWAPDVAVALQHHDCPLCKIAVFAGKQDEPERQIEGYLGTVIVPLLHENGQRAA
jgi:hypothetical protein